MELRSSLQPDPIEEVVIVSATLCEPLLLDLESVLHPTSIRGLQPSPPHLAIDRPISKVITTEWIHGRGAAAS